MLSLFNKKCRLWVLFAVLACSVQSLAYVGNMLLISQDFSSITSDHCQTGQTAGQASKPALDNGAYNAEVPVSENPICFSMNCCGEQCPMTHCYPGSAVLVQFNALDLLYGADKPLNTAATFPSEFISDFYRPPMLG